LLFIIAGKAKFPNVKTMPITYTSTILRAKAEKKRPNFLGKFSRKNLDLEMNIAGIIAIAITARRINVSAGVQ